MKTNDMYEELSKEWQMTSEEIQNAIYKEWHKKRKKLQAASAKLQATSSPAGLNLNTIKRYK